MKSATSGAVVMERLVGRRGLTVKPDGSAPVGRNSKPLAARRWRHQLVERLFSLVCDLEPAMRKRVLDAVSSLDHELSDDVEHLIRVDRL